MTLTRQEAASLGFARPEVLWADEGPFGRYKAGRAEVRDAAPGVASRARLVVLDAGPRSYLVRAWSGAPESTWARACLDRAIAADLAAAFDGRGWGDLWRDSPLHFPLPCGEAETLQLPPCRAMGGPGGEMGSEGSIYRFPGESVGATSQIGGGP